MSLTEAKLKWVDGERFVVQGLRGHAIVTDASGATATNPMELVLMALCGCTASDVVSILRKKREPFTGLEVRAEAERAPDPPKVYVSIKLIYTVSGGALTRKAVEDAVRLSEEKYCSVSAMLKSTARITTEIHLTGAPESELAQKI
jgi:putative redox protein